MSKHQPATPLPWKAVQSDNGIFHVLNADGAPYDSGEIAICYGEEVKAAPESAYIAHAANAYPKLVEALRDPLRRLVPRLNRSRRPRSNKSRTPLGC